MSDEAGLSRRANRAVRRPRTPATTQKRLLERHSSQADAGTRTPDPLLTMEVLYQLSYVGASSESYRGRRRSRYAPSAKLTTSVPAVLGRFAAVSGAFQGQIAPEPSPARSQRGLRTQSGRDLTDTEAPMPINGEDEVSGSIPDVGSYRNITAARYAFCPRLSSLSARRGQRIISTGAPLSLTRPAPETRPGISPSLGRARRRSRRSARRPGRRSTPHVRSAARSPRSCGPRRACRARRGAR